MTAEIVAIGTELLVGDIADTNSQTIARVFARQGVMHYHRVVVGDNVKRASLAISEALSRADLVVTIGGLGPTPDDITREAIADAIADQLVSDDLYLAYLRETVAARNRPWIDSIGRMAQKPSRAEFFKNNVGTAPGLLCPFGEKWVIALPGPPAELEYVLQNSVEPWLAKRSEAAMFMKTLRSIGVPESAVCERLGALLDGSNPTVATYAKKWEVHVRVASVGASQAAAAELAQPVVELVRDLFGKSVYGEDEQDLSEVVCNLLQHHGHTVAVAESCTGGMLSQRITANPGSSRVFLGGFVAYSNEMKARELSVARSDLSQFGAVSEPIAMQMAEGAIRQTGATYGMGVTGIAGPEGGTADKPVGLVFIALASHRGTEVAKNIFPGDRELIRYRATQVALNLLREELMRI